MTMSWFKCRIGTHSPQFLHDRIRERLDPARLLAIAGPNELHPERWNFEAAQQRHQSPEPQILDHIPIRLAHDAMPCQGPLPHQITIIGYTITPNG